MTQRASATRRARKIRMEKYEVERISRRLVLVGFCIRVEKYRDRRN